MVNLEKIENMKEVLKWLDLEKGVSKLVHQEISVVVWI